MAKKQKEPLVKQENTESPGIFPGIENYLHKRRYFFLYFITGIAVLLSVLNFDLKITTANDDALYIESGYKYARDFFNFYHIANAPLYPMLLSIPIAAFGINLLVIKVISMLFAALSIICLYYALRQRVPYLPLFVVLLVSASNYFFVFYSYQAYSEPLYMLVQALYLLIFFRLIEKEDLSLKNAWKEWLMFGFISFVISITRSIAAGLIAAPVLYFLIYRKWLPAVYSVVSFAAFRFLFEFVKKLIWGDISQFSNQSQIILQKHPYDASQGMEDFNGFIQRFFDNSNIYLSAKLPETLGFKALDSNINSSLTMLIWILLGFGVLMIFRSRNRYAVFTSIFGITLIGLTFVALQAFWGQHRFIMVAVPLLALIFIYGLYLLFSSKRLAPYQIFFLFICLPFIFVPVKASFQKGVKNIPQAKKNFKGDLYYGYTNDWKNYLKMSEWCGQNLPDTAMVACRKAPMSFVYAKGKEFHPVYNVSTQNADSLVTILKDGSVDYVIDARLRLNPKVNNGEYVNTVTRLLYYIDTKYKGAFTVVHEIGNETGEPAILYKVNYDLINKH